MNTARPDHTAQDPAADTTPTASPDAVDAAFAAVDRRADRLLSISHAIFGRPELAFDEHHAHDLLCDALEAEGLSVTRHAHGLDTAFVAEAGSEGPTVAVICEYDALPGVGHACGHNVIAAAGLGAGLAAAELADALGGRVRVIGTPAEEGGGGKVFMLRDGAFDDIDAAVMVHPADHDLPTMSAIAIQRLDVTYTGRASHAAAAPWNGVNALDAAVLGYVNVAALRQHIRPDERIHGIFTEAGEQANVVPRRAAASWYVRSPSVEGLAELGEEILQRIPFIKTMYGALKDLVEALVGSKRKFDRPVLVKFGGGLEAERLGFVTQEDLSYLGLGEGKVAVYFPHSFAWSGNLLIVPKQNVTALEARPADVMKFAVSGGVSQVDEEEAP